eukprot:GEMP01016620.1.p1 GENE.GEMP01016620.1~~GEMP01016620.1.p1  ORF type:complete len:628 (+),score=155.68 GEMP01016620.1:83-1966(+)
MLLWWVALAHAFPLYPYRDVRVPIKWQFSFSIDGKTNATPWETVNIPDAFDVRHIQHPNMPLESPFCAMAGDGEGGMMNARCASSNVTIPPNARGVGTYKLALLSDSVRVILHGCQMRCVVRVNGEFLADVVPMLAPVSIRLPAAKTKAVQELTIEVDNRFNDAEWPTHHPRFDWYQTGGLLRPVEIHRRVDIINSAFVLFVDFQTIHVRAESTSALVDTLYVSMGGSCSTETSGIPIAANVTFRVDVHGLVPWSPEEPNLHLLSVAAKDARNETIDCVVVRFGARTIRTENTVILLNDKPIKLKGVNRHESKSRGNVFSLEDLLLDIHALKALGVNFVRGSHYAQDSRFLDLCDENGIMVWEEVLGWQNTLNEVENPVFWLQTLDATRRMVEAHAHHPSIIFWGFLNEFIDANDARSTPYFTEMVDFIRALDGTRLITWGSSSTVNDVNLHLADVIAFHAYTAWYPTPFPLNVDDVASIPSVWSVYADWVRDNYGKPLLASEAGAGALYGMHGSSTGAKWSEEVQSVLVQMHVIGALQHPDMCGIAIWQFADSLVDMAFTNAEARPRGLNNKGLLSLSRERKISFSTVAKMFHSDVLALVLPDGEEEEEKNLEVWQRALKGDMSGV